MNNFTIISNPDFIMRFIIVVFSLVLLLRFIYYRHSSNRDVMFGFFLFGCGVFLITALLHDIEMSMGFAFGLFAVFSMLRYRTESISIHDMTYLFTVIVIALMSSVGPLSTMELVLLNLIVCGLTAAAETSVLAPRVIEKHILYERVDNIKPSMRNELIRDLNERMGLEITHVEVGKVDYLRDTAALQIFYKPEVGEKSTHYIQYESNSLVTNK